MFRNIKFLLQKFKLELENNTLFIDISTSCDICILVYLFISIVSYLSMKQYINILAPIYHRIMQEGQYLYALECLYSNINEQSNISFIKSIYFLILNSNTLYSDCLSIHSFAPFLL